MEKERKSRAAIINLGCKVNKYESDAMRDKLILAGYEMVDPEEKADVYIVNTCSVTNVAQRKSRQMLRRARNRNPEALIIAAGCYVNAEHEGLLAESFVDVAVGNNRKKDIVEIIRQWQENHGNRDFCPDIGREKEFEEMGGISSVHMDHRRAYVKIQDGCNQFCTYCLIPYTRGRVRSREPEQILSEIGQLAAEGVQEFVLTGIHISSYGSDREDGWELGGLIQAISELPDVRRVRLGSLEPNIITEEFLSGLADNPKFCPHFHLSLQSGCDATLKRMNRKYTAQEYADRCAWIRKYFDRPAITTDVIVGFPGETEEEYEETFAFLERLSLYEIHVFKYSVRAGTVAERLPDQVPDPLKALRSERLLALTARQKAAFEDSLSGLLDEVLVEERLGEPGDERTVERFKEESEEIMPEMEYRNEPAGSLNIEEPTEIQGGTAEENRNGTQLYETGEIKKTGKIWYWFTGHSKRYVKIKFQSDLDEVNRIVPIVYKG